MIEQLPLSACLPPLTLGQQVRVIADGREGWITQIWAGHDHYVIWSNEWGGPFTSLPVFRRDELEAL